MNNMEPCPLRSLVTNAPDWVKRINELSEQVEQRQLDLASLAREQGIESGSPTRSIKKRGSTESLKPRDDDGAFPTPDAPRQDAVTTARNSPTQQRRRSQAQPAPPQSSSNPDSDPRTHSSFRRQTEEVAATAQRRARAVLRKKPKTESMISAESVVPTYRTRSMIIVYYDSFVQSFFEELVKFVSAQRNQMRKAKMAAKVAEIKRLAELEMPDDDDEDDDDDQLQPGDALIAADPKISARTQRDLNAEDLKLRYMSTRILGPALYRPPNAGLVQMRGTLTENGLGAPTTGLGSLDQSRGDIYDELDRALEFVQSMCERAAHQFLRDGDCTEEISKIKKRLNEATETASSGIERLGSDISHVSRTSGPPNPRSYRPSTMRRDHGASNPTKKIMKVEVDDEGVEDM